MKADVDDGAALEPDPLPSPVPVIQSQLASLSLGSDTEVI